MRITVYFHTKCPALLALVIGLIAFGLKAPRTISPWFVPRGGTRIGQNLTLFSILPLQFSAPFRFRAHQPHAISSTHPRVSSHKHPHAQGTVARRALKTREDVLLTRARIVNLASPPVLCAGTRFSTRRSPTDHERSEGGLSNSREVPDTVSSA